MNKEMLEGTWDEIKGKIKSKWNKFTEDELETFKGNMQQIAGKIEKAYGFTKEQAQKEYNDFIGSINRKVENKFLKDDEKGNDVH